MPIYMLQKINPEDCERGESIRMIVIAFGDESARRLAHEESSNIEKEDEDWYNKEVTKCTELADSVLSVKTIFEALGFDKFNGWFDPKRVICHERR
jgi:hypothetical protein